MAKLQCLQVGEEIEDFTQNGGLLQTLCKAVCDPSGECSASCNNDDGGGECEGLAMMGIMENQIGHEAILFMKDLVKQWKDACR